MYTVTVWGWSPAGKAGVVRVGAKPGDDEEGVFADMVHRGDHTEAMLMRLEEYEQNLSLRGMVPSYVC